MDTNSNLLISCSDRLALLMSEVYCVADAIDLLRYIFSDDRDGFVPTDLMIQNVLSSHSDHLRRIGETLEEMHIEIQKYRIPVKN